MYIWDVILPFDELHHFPRWLNHVKTFWNHQPDWVMHIHVDLLRTRTSRILMSGSMYWSKTSGHLDIGEKHREPSWKHFLVGGDWNHGILNDFPYVGNNNPIWLSYFSQGFIKTTNQLQTILDLAISFDAELLGFNPFRQEIWWKALTSLVSFVASASCGLDNNI